MKVSWLIEKRVIFVDIGTSLTMPDLIDMNKEIINFLDISNTTVHIIYRATELQSFPTTFSSVGNTFTMVKHDNLGWSITINNNRVLKLIGTMVNKSGDRHTIKYLDTYGEAKEFLQTIDPTLPDLPDSID